MTTTPEERPKVEQPASTSSPLDLVAAEEKMRELRERVAAQGAAPDRQASLPGPETESRVGTSSPG